MPKIKQQTYTARPILTIDAMADVYDVILYNCGGTPARNGYKFYVHDVTDPSVFINHLAVATPLCYEYETYFNARGNNVFKLTYPPTGAHITIELIRH